MTRRAGPRIPGCCWLRASPLVSTNQPRFMRRNNRDSGSKDLQKSALTPRLGAQRDAQRPRPPPRPGAAAGGANPARFPSEPPRVTQQRWLKNSLLYLNAGSSLG